MEPDRPVNVTIHDVARRAKVASSSVSRVFSDHPDVSATMRARVQRAAAELGYEPDHLAQSLRNGRTMTVGFVLRDISNPLFAEVAQRCEHDLRRAGYSMIMMSSGGDQAVEAANLALLRRRRVDGVIASLVSETALATVAALQALTVPVLLVDREVAGLTAGAVNTDHFGGVRDACRELISAGHHKIALVTGTPDVRSTRERLRGVRAAFTEVGLPESDLIVRLGTFDAQHGRRAVAELIGGDAPPSVVLAGGVAVAIGAVRAIRDLGLTLGRDVVVVALDEWPDFDVLAPAMPSVRRDATELSTAIASHMLGLLAGGEPHTTTVPTQYSAGRTPSTSGPA